VGKLPEESSFGLGCRLEVMCYESVII
jgi:hypothetical protein